MSVPTYTVGRTISLLIISLIISVIAAIFVELMAFFLHIISLEEFKSNPLKFAVLAQGISYFPTFFFLLFFTKRFIGVSWKEIGLKNPKIKDIFIGLIGALVWFIISNLLGFLTIKFIGTKVDNSEYLLGKNPTPYQYIILTIVAVFGAPIIEEMAFRGIILNSIAHKYGYKIAIILSGILFGLMHLSLVNLFPLISVGIILGYFYNKTKNLWTSIVAHMCFNGIGMLQLLLIHP